MTGWGYLWLFVGSMIGSAFGMVTVECLIRRGNKRGKW